MDGCAFHSAWPSSASRKMWGLFRPAPMVWRVTHIGRKEDEVWKLMQRHANPLMGKRALVTVLQGSRQHANVGVHPALAAVIAQNSPTRGPSPPRNSLTM
jgi:hypothetical protein